MRSFEDDPVSEDQLDLDRIIIDAEYRRRVLAQLRQKRASAGPSCQLSASQEPDPLPRHRER